MMDKAAAGASRPAMPRVFLIAGLAALVVAALTATYAGAPYLFQYTTLQNEVATQIRETTGLVIATDHARFNLLPRPHVTMGGVHITDASGSVTLAANRLDGEVRLLPLIVGRIELSAVTLDKPRLSVDLDGRPIKPDSTIGRAVRRVDTSKDNLRRRLGSVTMIDGAVTLITKSLSQPLSLSDVDVTVDWRDLDSPATVTGSLQFQHTAAEIAGWVAQPSSLIRGDRSTVALRIHSAPLDFTATGDLAQGFARTFKGHVMASAPSLDGLLALCSQKLPLPAPFANVTLSSDATISLDGGTLASADLQTLNLRADGNAYEGTIAYTGGDRPLISGTLATDRLVLAPFFAQAPSPLAANRHWSDVPLAPVRLGAVNLDIRISGAHLRVAPLNIDDVALSVMTRGDRLEIGLNEGKAYGGSIKGRVSLGFGDGGLSVRAAGTVAAADLTTLTWDALGWQAASGSLSGSVNVESVGDAPAALMAHLQGWAKGRATDGEIFGIDLARELLDAGRTPTGGAVPITFGGRTPFTSSTAGLHITEGQAIFDSTALRGPGAALMLAGTANLVDRTFDLHASVQPPTASATSSPNDDAAPKLRLGVTGGFDHAVIAPERGATQPAASAHAP